MATCCADNCPNSRKFTAKQVFVSCWLCENIAHVGCAGFGQYGGRIADRKREHSGLDWTCPSCLHIKPDMRIFMRQTHLEFQSLAAGFKELSNRFQKAEQHFKSLQLLSDPVNKPRSYLSDSLLPISDPASTPLMQFTPRNKSTDNAVDADDGSDDEVVSATRSGPDDLDVPLALQLINIDQASTSPAPLAGVAPKKFAFVSRLNPGASEHDVKTHLSNKFNISCTEFTVSKFNFKQRREISSFKIGLSDALLARFLDTSVWPEHAIVHEFVHN
ncbi:hypothetical protein KR054_007431 [Drosophila jambulina]|nr:hypothetical protein KR054_007431 [Drosophila jambulina]